MTEGDRHGAAKGWERDVGRLVEHGRHREAVQLAARRLVARRLAGDDVTIRAGVAGFAGRCCTPARRGSADPFP